LQLLDSVLGALWILSFEENNAIKIGVWLFTYYYYYHYYYYYYYYYYHYYYSYYF